MNRKRLRSEKSQHATPARTTFKKKSRLLGSVPIVPIVPAVGAQAVAPVPVVLQSENTEWKSRLKASMVHNRTATPSSQAASISAAAAAAGESKIIIISIPPGPFILEPEYAKANAQVQDYISHVIDYCIDLQSADTAGKRYRLNGAANEHLTFMKQWITTHYVTYHMSGVEEHLFDEDDEEDEKETKDSKKHDDSTDPDQPGLGLDSQQRGNKKKTKTKKKKKTGGTDNSSATMAAELGSIRTNVASLGAMMHYARMWLMFSCYPQTCNQVMKTELGRAVLTEKTLDTILQNWMLKLYESVVLCQRIEISKWLMIASEFELLNAYACVWTETMAPGRLEDLARMYSWMQLQLFFARGTPSIPGEPAQSPVSCRRYMEMNEVESTQAKAVVENIRKRFLSRETSDDFVNLFADFLYDHFMGGGLGTKYNRVMRTINERATTVTKVNTVFSDRELIRFRTLASYPPEKLAVWHPNIKLKDSLEQVISPKYVRTAQQLLFIYIFAYTFQQYMDVPWLQFYYVSLGEFHTHFKKLLETERWNKAKRPTMFDCLGRYCLSTFDRRLYYGSTADEAMATWLTIMMVEHNLEIEHGVSLDGFTQYFTPRAMRRQGPPETKVAGPSLVEDAEMTLERIKQHQDEAEKEEEGKKKKKRGKSRKTQAVEAEMETDEDEEKESKDSDDDDDND